MVEKVDIYKTETYKEYLIKLDNTVREMIEKKVMKLLENPNVAKPMKYQHKGYCEIQVGDKYRVYCIKKQNKIGLLFILGPAVHHKENYQDSKSCNKIFNILDKIECEFSRL